MDQLGPMPSGAIGEMLPEWVIADLRRRVEAGETVDLAHPTECTFCGRRIGQGREAMLPPLREMLARAPGDASLELRRSEARLLRQVENKRRIEHILPGPGISICDLCIELANEELLYRRERHGS